MEGLDSAYFFTRCNLPPDKKCVIIKIHPTARASRERSRTKMKSSKQLAAEDALSSGKAQS